MVTEPQLITRYKKEENFYIQQLKVIKDKKQRYMFAKSLKMLQDLKSKYLKDEITLEVFDEKLKQIERGILPK